jgi:hypothetical protein
MSDGHAFFNQRNCAVAAVRGNGERAGIRGDT